MSVINKQSRRAKAREIQRRLGRYGSLLLAFFTIMSVLGFFFQDTRVLQRIFGSSPDIRFQILSPVPVNSVILQGIAITNRGGVLAKDLTINATYNETMILGQYYDSDVFIDLHDIKMSDSKRAMEFKIDQFNSNTSGIVYMKISKKGEVPKVTIEYQNGSGQEESYDIPRIFIWIMSMGGASTAILLFLLIRRFWRFITS
jgi:hypothetical protein